MNLAEICRCGHTKLSHLFLSNKCLKGNCDCNTFAPEVTYVGATDKPK